MTVSAVFLRRSALAFGGIALAAAGLGVLLALGTIPEGLARWGILASLGFGAGTVCLPRKPAR